MREYADKHTSKSKIITQTCPHCERDITFSRDLEKDGYMIYCPYCGERIMLCDACQTSVDNLIGRCDEFGGKCFRGDLGMKLVCKACGSEVKRETKKGTRLQKLMFYCPDCKMLLPQYETEFVKDTTGNNRELRVDTPLGPISARIMPDKDYPGIWIGFNGGNGEPGAIIEYAQDMVQMRVYDREDPDGEPAAILPMSSDYDREPVLAKTVVDALFQSFPDCPVKDGSRIWQDGNIFLCPNEEEANRIADTIVAAGGNVTTGYFDPKEDERNGDVDEYTGYWYVEVF